MSGSVATGARPVLSRTKEIRDPRGVSSAHPEWWEWPERDIVQMRLAFARLPDLHEAMKHIWNFGVCIQAGGNMGVWPQYLSTVFKVVYTFEPDPLNFRCLAANVREENVFKFNTGLGHHSSPRDMKRTDNCGAHRMSEKSGPIPVVNLDAFALECDFLQLDVEGFEHAALCGAAHTIMTHHPVIMIEDKAFKRRAIERGEGIEKAESDCSRLLRSWGYDIAAAFTENGSCDFLYVWRDF